MTHDYLIRVVYEYEDEIPVVITLYIARKERYFRGGICEKPEYGEEYSENIIIHYSERKSVLEQKPLKQK